MQRGVIDQAGTNQMGEENVRSLEGAEIKYFWLLTPAEIPIPASAGLRGQLLASQLSSAPWAKVMAGRGCSYRKGKH